MNNHQKQQAQNLYFQTDLTKTQIAELLNISRRSLHYWIRDNNWDRLKKSATLLPALLAENCYHIISHFTEHLLSERRLMTPITSEEANTLHKLTLTVNKLKKQTTLNENMQVFACFMARIKARSPELVEVIQPHVNDFIAAQAGQRKQQVMPESFDDMGFLPIKEENKKEADLDLGDIMAWIDDNKDEIPENQPQQQQSETTNSNNGADVQAPLTIGETASSPTHPQMDSYPQDPDHKFFSHYLPDYHGATKTSATEKAFESDSISRTKQNQSLNRAQRRAQQKHTAKNNK